jgi:hypothetical protein
MYAQSNLAEPKPFFGAKTAPNGNRACSPKLKLLAKPWVPAVNMFNSRSPMLRCLRVWVPHGGAPVDSAIWVFEPETKTSKYFITAGAGNAIIRLWEGCVYVRLRKYLAKTYSCK